MSKARRFFSPVGERVEEFIVDNARNELWIASGYISPDMASTVRAWKIENLRLMIGVNPGQVRITSSLHACLQQLASMPQVSVRCLANLHAKVYLAPKRSAIVGSAKLLRNGLEYLEEAAVELNDPGDLATVKDVLEAWWLRAKRLSELTVVESENTTHFDDGWSGTKSAVPLHQSAFSDLIRAHRDDDNVGDEDSGLSTASWDDRTRPVMQQLFAHCIAVFPSGKGRWNLTATPDKLRLNAGPLTVLQEVTGWTSLHVARLPANLRQELEADGIVRPGFKSAYKFASAPLWITFSTDHADRWANRLLPFYVEFAESVTERCRWLAHHDQRAVDELELVTGRSLPKP